MIAILRTAVFYVVFVIGSVGYVLAGFVAAQISAHRLRRLTIAWGRFHNHCARWLLGIRPRLVGEIPPGPILFAARHESMFETIAFLVILDEPAVVLKNELARLPLWGKIARMYGAIPVDRGGSAAALRAMLRAGRAAVNAGRPIVIFPEGTRIPHGESAPLRPGFAGLYRALGLPVVPVAVDAGRIWPRRRFAKQAGLVTFRFGAPIPPGLPREEIEQRVGEAIRMLNPHPSG